MSVSVYNGMMSPAAAREGRAHYSMEWYQPTDGYGNPTRGGKVQRPVLSNDGAFTSSLTFEGHMPLLDIDDWDPISSSQPVWRGEMVVTPSKHLFWTPATLTPREYNRVSKAVDKGLPGMKLLGRSGKSKAPIRVQVELTGWSVFASKTDGHFHGYCHTAVEWKHYIKALNMLAKYGLGDTDWVILAGCRGIALLARAVPR